MMQAHGNAPWHMGGIEWLELTVFWSAAAVVCTVLILSIARQPAAPLRPPIPPGRWRNWPETRLVMLGLPLELLWELAQFPLYDVWHQNDWSYILYGLAHCTLGDLLILLAIYEIIALLGRDRTWYATRGIWTKGLLFTLLGAGYTIYSELTHVRIKGTWGYTELMPIVPLVEIGAMPLLQWLLVPPLLLWLMRITRVAQEIKT